jgi:hypothetical protein
MLAERNEYFFRRRKSLYRPIHSKRLVILGVYPSFKSIQKTALRRVWSVYSGIFFRTGANSEKSLRARTDL